MKKIAIYGAGGLGREIKTIIDAINRCNLTYEFLGFFDDYASGNHIIGGKGELNSWNEPIFIVLGVGGPEVKEKIVSQINNANIVYETIIHPRAIIGDEDQVKIGEGTVIGAGSILTTNIEIEKHVLINLNVTVGHDTIIKSFTSVMPGVNIAGGVTIGSSVLIGSGAGIINAAQIGDKAIVGAGALVVKAVPSAVTVIGIPAKERL